MGEKTTISVRITPQLRKRLDEVSAQNGRSLSQEVEIRLEQSFPRIIEAVAQAGGTGAGLSEEQFQRLERMIREGLLKGAQK